MGEGSETSCLYPHNLLRITGEKAEAGDSFLTLTVQRSSFQTNYISFK